MTNATLRNPILPGFHRVGHLPADFAFFEIAGRVEGAAESYRLPGDEIQGWRA
ncbi:hypothetical protein ACFTSF_32945 [Kribbella sp. NPDC056951]|uniref:hypothetical protein n=1 Tax=Kribbella sp. NPDC056951 TaxID=3345978 RepID=UPI003643F547